MQEVVVVSSNEKTSIIDIQTDNVIYTLANNSCSSINGGTYSKQRNIFIFAQAKKDGVHIYYPTKETPHPYHTTQKITTVSISNDGIYLAAGSSQGNVLIWQLSNGELVRLYNAHYRGISEIHFTSDNSFLVTASLDSTIKSWNLSDVLDCTQINITPPSYKVISDHHLGVTGLKCLSKLGWIVSCSLDMTVKVIDTLEGAVLLSKPMPSALHCIAVNSFGTTVFTGGTSGKIFGLPIYGSNDNSHFFRSQTNSSNKQEMLEFEGHKASVTGIQVCFDDQRLVTSGEDGKVNIWDITSQQIIKTIFSATSGHVNNLMVLLFPITLPLEKSLSNYEPLGAGLRKHPCVDHKTLVVNMPNDKLLKRKDSLFEKAAKRAKTNQFEKLTVPKTKPTNTVTETKITESKTKPSIIEMVKNAPAPNIVVPVTKPISNEIQLEDSESDNEPIYPTKATTPTDVPSKKPTKSKTESTVSSDTTKKKKKHKKVKRPILEGN